MSAVLLQLFTDSLVGSLFSHVYSSRLIVWKLCVKQLIFVEVRNTVWNLWLQIVNLSHENILILHFLSLHVVGDMIVGVYLCDIQWLGKTVLSRLVAEIDDMNALLVRAGSDDVQIGGESTQ